MEFELWNFRSVKFELSNFWVIGNFFLESMEFELRKLSDIERIEFTLRNLNVFGI